MTTHTKSFTFEKPDDEQYEAFKKLCRTSDRSVGSGIRLLIKKAVERGSLE